MYSTAKDIACRLVTKPPQPYSLGPLSSYYVLWNERLFAWHMDLLSSSVSVTPNCSLSLPIIDFLCRKIPPPFTVFLFHTWIPHRLPNNGVSSGWVSNRDCFLIQIQVALLTRPLQRKTCWCAFRGSIQSESKKTAWTFATVSILPEHIQFLSFSLTRFPPPLFLCSISREIISYPDLLKCSGGGVRG